MKQIQIFINIFSACLIILLAVSCDPVSREESEAIVRFIIDGPMEMGKYTKFWDGHNNKGDYVDPGIYYVRLYSKDFSDQVSITVEEGGSNAANYDEKIDYGSFGFTQLSGVEPNPFKVKNGTNISFIIGGEDAGKTIQLSIRNRK